MHPVVRADQYLLDTKTGHVWHLVENQKDGFFEGYDQFFNKVKIKSDKDISKEWIVISECEVQEKSNFANLKG